jgi:hypothetical protein
LTESDIFSIQDLSRRELPSGQGDDTMGIQIQNSKFRIQNDKVRGGQKDDGGTIYGGNGEEG